MLAYIPYMDPMGKEYTLFGGLEHGLMIFPIYYGNVVIPTDELHHFSEG